MVFLYCHVLCRLCAVELYVALRPVEVQEKPYVACNAAGYVRCSPHYICGSGLCLFQYRSDEIYDLYLSHGLFPVHLDSPHVPRLAHRMEKNCLGYGYGLYAHCCHNSTAVDATAFRQGNRPGAKADGHGQCRHLLLQRL